MAVPTMHVSEIRGAIGRPAIGWAANSASRFAFSSAILARRGTRGHHYPMTAPRADLSRWLTAEAWRSRPWLRRGLYRSPTPSFRHAALEPRNPPPLA